jgi:ABC-type polysaccharide/polyol phosphate export permease
MTHFVGATRHAVYLLQPPTLLNWAAMLTATAITLLGGWVIFSKKAPRFIEEI